MQTRRRCERARRLDDRLLAMLNLRPEDEFIAGHLPQAINIPLRELVQRLHDLPKDREVVAYCRGPYCVFAFEAVALLRRQGFEARRLEDGYPEWKTAGLPVAQGATAMRSALPGREALLCPTKPVAPSRRQPQKPC